MKVILDIKDSKAAFVLELLRNFSFVKTEFISTSKAQFIKDLNLAINEVNLAKQGKTKLKTADDLLNEL